MRDPKAVILHLADSTAALETARKARPQVSFEGCDSYDALFDIVARTEADIVYTVRFAGTPGFPRAVLV